MSPSGAAGDRDRAPADQAVREGAQRDLDTSIFLQAGAGTGKTSVLVGRVIEAVRRGRAELREIVAITFTEKAAGELRDRVRRDLYRALNSADAAEQDRLRAAIQQVDAAHIETIHAFASSLLRERPLDAALDPGFEVMDAVSEQLRFDEDWQNWLWSEEQGAARPRIERCLRLGLRLEHLRRLAFEIAEFRDLEARERAPAVPLAGDVLDGHVRRARRIHERAAGGLAGAGDAGGAAAGADRGVDDGAARGRRGRPGVAVDQGAEPGARARRGSRAAAGGLEAVRGGAPGLRDRRARAGAGRVHRRRGGLRGGGRAEPASGGAVVVPGPAALRARPAARRSPRAGTTSGVATSSCWSTSSRTRTRCRRRS